jgi:hypothetical protein
MATIGSIVILELRLNEDTLTHYFILNGSNECNQGLLICIREVSSALRIFYHANWVC